MALVPQRLRRPPKQAGSAPDEPRHFDAVTLLTIYVLLLLGVESRWVIGPLGGAGTPAMVLVVVGLGWWIYHHVQRVHAPQWMSQPVRFAAAALFLAYCASYVAAMLRPISGIESSSADLGMFGLLGWMGLVLLANDGVPDRARLDVLLHRLVIGGALVGALGVAQYLTHEPLIRWISWPGLVTNAPLGDLMSRSGFTRPAATALHPIEFGAIMTAILPIAISRARTVVGGQRWWAWTAVFLIALGMIVSGSRSAILTTLVGLAVLAVAWSPLTRLLASGAVVVALGFVAVALPGMAGSLTKLFTGFSEDGSIKSRTGSYEIVGEFVSRQPWFGRGGSTFLPSYRILDNQYLISLIEIGVVGLVAFLALLFTAFHCARLAFRHAPTPAAAEQAQGLAAAVAAAAVGLGTYDGLSFPTATGILFLLVGVCGATWRLTRREQLTRARTQAVGV